MQIYGLIPVNGEYVVKKNNMEISYTKLETSFNPDGTNIWQGLRVPAPSCGSTSNR